MRLHEEIQSKIHLQTIVYLKKNDANKLKVFLDHEPLVKSGKLSKQIDQQLAVSGFKLYQKTWFQHRVARQPKMPNYETKLYYYFDRLFWRAYHVPGKRYLRSLFKKVWR